MKRQLLRTVKIVRTSSVLVAKTRGFWGQSVKLSANGNLLVCEKGRFSAHAKQPDKEKTFFSAPRQQFRTAPKLTSSNPFSNTACCCELAAHLLFFVKTSVLRLHYGNPFAPIQSLFAGVLRAKPVSTGAAEIFCKITSGRALNRPRSPEVRKPLVYFWFFSYTRKE